MLLALGTKLGVRSRLIFEMWSRIHEVKKERERLVLTWVRIFAYSQIFSSNWAPFCRGMFSRFSKVTSFRDGTFSNSVGLSHWVGFSWSLEAQTAATRHASRQNLRLIVQVSYSFGCIVSKRWSAFDTFSLATWSFYSCSAAKGNATSRSFRALLLSLQNFRWSSQKAAKKLFEFASES